MSIFMQSCKGCKGPGFWPINGPMHLAPPRNAAKVRFQPKNRDVFMFSCFHLPPIPPPRDPGGTPPLAPANSAGCHAPRTPRPTRAGWHAHACVGMSWRCRGRSSSHGHALRGHATQQPCRPPPSSSRPEGRRPVVEDPFKQPFHKAPDAMPQQHQRCRFATLKNGFLDPRCFAPLRTASLGMTMMRPPDARAWTE